MGASESRFKRLQAVAVEDRGGGVALRASVIGRTGQQVLQSWVAFRCQRRAGWSRCCLYVSLCCLLQPAAHETQATCLQSRNEYGEVGRSQVASMSSNYIYTEVQFCEGQRPLSALGRCGWQNFMARSLWELIGRPVIIRSSTRQEEPFSGAQLPH